MEEIKRKGVKRFALMSFRLPKSLIVVGVVLGIVLTCVVGCGGAGVAPVPASREVAEEVVVEREMAPSEPLALAAEGYDAASFGLAQPVERLIIRNGRISMTVDDTLAAQATIEQMVGEMAGEGAFVVSSEEQGRGEEGSPYIVMSIRVPVTRFDATMDRLAGLAVQVTNRNESGQDVTEEYVDLEARLESLEAARQRLLGIMEEARTTKDLLEAEQQLTQREAEIESIKGRMQYLAQSAALASIWIELQPYILRQPVSERWRPLETARRALETLVDAVRGFGDFFIFFAIAILPWLLLLGLAIFVIVRLVTWRTRARRKKDESDAEPSG
jgi:hypothetical protein